ncbi:MAG: hypothetical protein ACE5FS_01090 [Paracoccaceae bacterium]
MPMFRILLAVAGMLCATVLSAAATEDWVKLSDSQILSALSGRALDFGDAVQTFLPSGRTSFDAGSISWGYWRVEQGRYCSQWPPADLWTCYTVESNDGGIRFVGADGSLSEGRYR